jgi:hypothetical protein
MRYQRRTGTSVEECARQTGERLRTLGAPRRRVAGRQDYPVGVEFEGRNLSWLDPLAGPGGLPMYLVRAMRGAGPANPP